MGKMLTKYQSVLISILLISVTFGTFWPVLKHEFVKYDDDRYVTENPHVTGGITLQSVVWAFTRPHFYMWHPVTSLSHLLDCELFGLNPFGHHLTSLLLHIANVLLLFWVLKWLTGAVWPSAFVAAMFAVHPLQVESVAWVAERKNVLSALFWMLTIAAYIRYTERPSIGRYLLVVLTFSLGLMAKPTVVTLPCVLLLLDYWPLQRLQWHRQSKCKNSQHTGSAETGRQQLSFWRLFGREGSPVYSYGGRECNYLYCSAERQCCGRVGNYSLKLSSCQRCYFLRNIHRKDDMAQRFGGSLSVSIRRLFGGPAGSFSSVAGGDFGALRLLLWQS